MTVATSHVEVDTKGGTDVIDITGKIAAVVKNSGMRDGSAVLFVSGSTGGLTTIEYETNAVNDLKDAFERIAPKDGFYAHHETWGDDNGHSHVRASLLGPSLTVPFTGKKLCLGTWQQIVFVDFDTRARKRRLVIQLHGE